MLSQRTAAHEPLANAGSIPALLQLLDPVQSPCAVDNAAKALGNLSGDAACRSLIRSSGGVGALVRMIKDDCPDIMQVSSDDGLSCMSLTACPTRHARHHPNPVQAAMVPMMLLLLSKLR